MTGFGCLGLWCTTFLWWTFGLVVKQPGHGAVELVGGGV
jgi:hypothetical protein